MCTFGGWWTVTELISIDVDFGSGRSILPVAIVPTPSLPRTCWLAVNRCERIVCLEVSRCCAVPCSGDAPDSFALLHSGWFSVCLYKQYDRSLLVLVSRRNLFLIVDCSRPQ